jgi:hypothetical protein
MDIARAQKRRFLCAFLHIVRAQGRRSLGACLDIARAKGLGFTVALAIACAQDAVLGVHPRRLRVHRDTVFGKFHGDCFCRVTAVFRVRP